MFRRTVTVKKDTAQDFSDDTRKKITYSAKPQRVRENCVDYQSEVLIFDTLYDTVKEKCKIKLKCKLTQKKTDLTKKNSKFSTL